MPHYSTLARRTIQYSAIQHSPKDLTLFMHAFVVCSFDTNYKPPSPFPWSSSAKNREKRRKKGLSHGLKIVGRKESSRNVGGRREGEREVDGWMDRGGERNSCSLMY